MEILNKLQSISESLGIGKIQVEEVKSEVEVYGQAKFEEGKLAGFEEGKKAGYEEGFQAGVASVPVSPVGEVPPQGDKIYSQAEFDQKIAEEKAAQLVDLELKLESALQQEAIDLKTALFPKV